MPNWDFASLARASGDSRALVLIEAKAHKDELKLDGKKLTERSTPEEQKRTKENHERIGQAIAEASGALAQMHSGVSLSRDKCYQFCNRVAYAWKLATMGIPVALIYLGFLGDKEMGDYFEAPADWTNAFHDHTKGLWPRELIGQEIACGSASFWLFVESLQVQRQSPPKHERKILK